MTDGQGQRAVVSVPFQITRNHGFPFSRILELIKNSLNPIPCDPIPKSILIHDIIIKQTGQDILEIECQVLYEY